VGRASGLRWRGYLSVRLSKRVNLSGA
jgi:hypothetical protein